MSLTRDAVEIRAPRDRETVPVDEILELRVSPEDPGEAPEVRGYESRPSPDERFYVAFRTATHFLMVPNLPEKTARSLDDQVRSALRELRGATR